MATADRWPIVWGGRLVGWIASPRFDMPFYYGRWVAEDGPVAIEFLSELRKAVDRDDGLEVVVASGLNGVVYVHPDDNDGELDIRWR